MASAKTFNIYKYQKTKNPIRGMRDKVLECLGDSIFEIQTTQDFAYESLKCFYPINKALKNDLASIETACKKVFSLFPIIKGRLYELEANGKSREIISKEKPKNTIEQFLHTYLQFEEAPGKVILYLQRIVKQDMFEINELIIRYEKIDCIKEYLSKGKTPKSHDERIVFDFYQRCLKEQRIITDYYLTGLKKRAIAKANYWGSAIKQLIKMSERYRDRPYQYALHSSTAYFDYEKIDLIANKVSDFPVDNSLKLEKLYDTNRAAFYRHLFKKHTPAQIWQELKYYLQHLPLKNDRKPIFDELEKLYKRKSWIGFYALALTQIEGLFSEMYNILNPSAATNRKALPDKVEYARKYHEMSHYYFDYYQYHIPKLRNKFMHYGFEEDYKLKSYDLLFDLRYLVKVFTELDNPLIKINQIHLKRRYEDFITYGDFAKYFELLNGLTAQQNKEIQESIKSFEKEFLIEYCNAGYVCMEVVQELPVVAKRFLENNTERLSKFEKSFDFFERNLEKLKKAIKDDKDLSQTISDCFVFNRHETEALINYNIFLSNYKKYLSSIESDYKQLLDETYKKHQTVLRNISAIHVLLATNEQY